MGLFSVPKREEVNIHKTVQKINTAVMEKPTIKIKGKHSTLLDKLVEIGENVKRNLGSEKGNYLCITKDEDFVNYCRNAVKDGYISLDTETTGLEYKDQHNLVGISLMSKSQLPMYAPIGHISTVTEQYVPNQVSKQAVIEGIKVLVDNNVKFIFHNAYYDLVVIYLYTDIWLDVYWDTVIGAFLLNENESHSLKYLYDKYCMEGQAGVHKFAELFEGIPFCYVPYNIGYIYGAHDAEMTYRLYEFQLPYLTEDCEECIENDLVEVAHIFNTVEIPIIRVISEMRVTGIEIDNNIAKKLHEKYINLKEIAKNNFEKLTSFVDDSRLPSPIDYNSPQQLSILFYDILKFPIVDKNEKRGTGRKIREKLKTVLKDDKYIEILNAIEEVKTYDKLLGSFVDKIPAYAEYDGKVHTGLNSIGARTGRFSSNSPNLQQVPARFNDIRHMFVAGSDNVIIGADFKKQEVLVAAITADDDNLLQAFIDGKDVYSDMASRAWHLPYEECCEFYADGSTNKEGKKRRKKAKAVMLGLMYGKQTKATADDLGISVEEAQDIIDNIFGAYPKLKQCIDDTNTYLHKHGYVKTIYGVKRRLPGALKNKYDITINGATDENTIKYYQNVYLAKLNKLKYKKDINDFIYKAKQKGVYINDNSSDIAKCERESFNARIQGASSTICKKSLINIYNNKRLNEMGVKLILTIHDEQLCICPKKYAYEASKIIEQCCINSAPDFKVKLACDMAISESWEGEPLTFNDNKELVKLTKTEDK